MRVYQKFREGVLVNRQEMASRRRDASAEAKRVSNSSASPSTSQLFPRLTPSLCFFPPAFAFIGKLNSRRFPEHTSVHTLATRGDARRFPGRLSLSRYPRAPSAQIAEGYCLVYRYAFLRRMILLLAKFHTRRNHVEMMEKLCTAAYSLLD